MGCDLVGDKPLSELMLTYCVFEPMEQTSVKSQAKFIHFHSRKCIWKFCLRNGGNFVSTSMLLEYITLHSKYKHGVFVVMLSLRKGFYVMYWYIFFRDASDTGVILFYVVWFDTCLDTRTMCILSAVCLSIFLCGYCIQIQQKWYMYYDKPYYARQQQIWQR